MNNRIKLVALDMDGTLLDSQKRIPNDFEDWVLSHPEIKTVIASGRQYWSLLNLFPKCRDSLSFSAENGALVFDQGKCIYRNSVSQEITLSLIDEFTALPGFAPILCGAKSAYMLGEREEYLQEASLYYAHLQILDDLRQCPEISSLVKFALYCKDDIAAHKVSLLTIPKGMKSVVSGTDWIDIGNEDVNKGTGIKQLASLYGIPKESCMAFGDYMNDYEMLLAAGESYCMANGTPELKKIAKHITSSNDDDGVMKVLRTL